MSLSFAVIFSSASSGILFPPSAEKMVIFGRKLQFMHVFDKSTSSENQYYRKIDSSEKSDFSEYRTDTFRWKKSILE